MNAWLTLVSLLMFVWAFYNFRFASVFGVRTDVIFDRSIAIAIEDLPGLLSMIFHPKHLHRWTVKQWIKYVEAQRG